MVADVSRIDARTMADLIFLADDSLSYEHREILQRAATNSECLYMGTVDGVAICFYGLIPPTLMSDNAYLWLYTTPKFKEHTFIFVRHSQMVIEEMLKLYPRIHGHGKVGDRRSLEWLKFLGAKFGEPQGQFLPFEIKARAA